MSQEQALSFSIIIPARYGSTRLAGKPLLDIAGQTMIERVYRQASSSNADQVIVATDDQRILATVNNFGGQVVMTNAEHPTGTDRLQEVAAKRGFDDQHIIVNVQGDEPLIPAEAINQLAENLQNHSVAGIATLCEQITDTAEIFDPNAVKVVRDKNQFAQYFSRAPIPWLRGWPAPHTLDFQSAELSALIASSKTQWYRHIGMYAYRVSVLNQYVSWAVCEQERVESLEQLRALDNGVKIHCAETYSQIPAGVDTEQDLARVRAQFESNT